MRGIAQLARSSIEDPLIPISSERIGELIGGGKTLAGVSVSEDRAYGLSAWYRGVVVVAGTMAQLPLKVYRNGTRERVRARTVLDNPNPAQTPFEFWQTMYANALNWGNCYGRKLRDGADVVRTVWPVHPSRVRVDIVDPTDRMPDGKLFHVRHRDGTERDYTSWDIFHMPYLSPHGFVGIPPLRFARQVLGINVAAEDTSARFYGSGSRLSGLLLSKRKLDDTKARELKTRWRERVAGPENAGDIAVLDSDTTFQPLAIPPQDAQLLDSRKFGVTEVARLLGVAPWLLFDLEASSSWGTGIEQQKIGLVQFTMQPWISLGEQRVTRELLPGGRTASTWYAEYSLEGLLRGDSKTRAEYYRIMTQNGLMVRNEGRALENLEPIEGGDEPLLPAGVMPASVAEQKVLIDALGALVRAGFQPAAAAEALGLDPIAHTGLVPVTVTVGEQLTPPASGNEGGADAGSNADA